MESSSSGAEADGVPCPNVCRKRFFELSDFGTGGEPIRSKDLDHRLDIFLGNRMPAVGEEFCSNGFSSKNGKITVRCG